MRREVIHCNFLSIAPRIQRSGELEDILKEIGLEPAELVSAQTQHDEDRARGGDGLVAFQYNFDGGEVFRPKLTFYFEGDQPVDATLSADTKKYLIALVANRRKAVSDDVSNLVNDSTRRASTLSDDGSNSVNDSIRRESSVFEDGLNSVHDSQIRRIEILLTFDAKFFELLQGDLTNLDELQAEEQKAMTEQITELSKEITRLTYPSKFAKTDMYRWRALFDIYLQACVFFSTREQDHGSRNSTVAARQLEWFQGEVTRRGLVEAFKLPASRQALDRFVAINIMLLQNLKFQEINKKAIGKILKSRFSPSPQLDDCCSIAQKDWIIGVSGFREFEWSGQLKVQSVNDLDHWGSSHSVRMNDCSSNVQNGMRNGKFNNTSRPSDEWFNRSNGLID